MKYVLAFLCLTLSALAIGQTAKEIQRARDSVAEHLPPIPDSAIVYIIRSSIVAFAVPMRLDCDSFQVGWVGVKSYLYTVLAPGDHIFKAKSENESDLKITVEAGKIYFINQEPRMGFTYARVKLKPMTEVEGRKYLRKCGLSKHNQYPLYPLSNSVENDPPAN